MVQNQTIINFKQSYIYDVPINIHRAPQVGDRFRFTGEVKVIEHFEDRCIDLPIFEEIHTSDLITISVSTLMHSSGTIRIFLKNFNTVGKALERAMTAKVIFNVVGETVTDETFDGELRKVRTLIINCEN